MTAPLERLVDRHARDRQTVLTKLTTLLLRLLGQVDPYRGDQVAAFGQQAATAVRAAQNLTARDTQAYLRSALTMMDSAPSRRLTPVRLPAELRGAVKLTEVYERPAREVRYLESVELDPDRASRRGRARLLVLADDDLQLAEREAARQTLLPVEQVVGWRRVLRPELSKDGPCGLCIVASDRLYGRGDLKEIHERCKCAVLPVTEGSDPGQRINVADLKRIYAAAGGTDPARLKRVRIEVHQHGELGPVLRRAGDDFRGPKKAANASPPYDRKSSARAEIAALERTYAALLDRQAAGEDVAGPLEWQRARLEALRGQLAD